jgi:hypothetical protein
MIPEVHVSAAAVMMCNPIAYMTWSSVSDGVAAV